MIKKLLRPVRRHWRTWQERRRDRAAIVASGLFDATWYALHHPPVSPLDALDDFLIRGAAFKRSPGPDFDTRSYLAANPDLASSGVNPLIHYLKHGIAEGRRFAPRLPVTIGSHHDRGRIDFSLIIVGSVGEDVDITLSSIAYQRSVDVEIFLSSFVGSAAGAQPHGRAAAHQGHLGASIQTIVAPDPETFLLRALKQAGNAFVVILDAGDVLLGSALAALTHRIAGTGCDVVYSDEVGAPTGTVSIGGRVRKPTWSPELLTSCNYVGRLTAIRRTVALAALVRENHTIAEWDLNLRVAELTPLVERVPLVLCQRTGAAKCYESTVLVRENSRILKNYWRNKGLEAQVGLRSDGTYHATWPLVSKPLVSVIVSDNNRTVNNIFNSGSYSNIEMILIESATSNIDDESRKRNAAALSASGDLLLFLDGGLCFEEGGEVVESDWLEELVRQVLRPGVGIVGPKLVHPDGTIRHAGMALGSGPLARGLFRNGGPGACDLPGTSDTQRNVVAVTDAFQLVRRSAFEAVGGYDEAFAGAYGGLVLCLDAGRVGFRTVYVPAATLIVHPNASFGRGTPDDEKRLARRLRALGMSEDPYCPSDLDGTDPISASLEPDDFVMPRRPVQARVETLLGEDDTTGPVDLHDDGAVAAAMGCLWDSVSEPFDPKRMDPGLASAAQVLIWFLRRRRDLRARFPKALLQGGTGPFASWVKAEGLGLLGLGVEHAPWIDAAFAADPGARARHWLVRDEILRAETSLFLLPDGRRATCRSLFAAIESGLLRREEVWWFLLTSAEDPLSEIFRTWAITPQWQMAVPDGGTVFGATRLVRWVAETYDIAPDWLFAQTEPALMSPADQVRLAYIAHPAWRASFPDALSEPATAEALVDHLTTRAAGVSFIARAWASAQDRQALSRAITRPGVNLLGHFAYPSGLRSSTESIVAGLMVNGVDVSLRDVPVGFATDDPIGHRFSGCEVHGTTLVHVQPEPFFNLAYERSGLHRRAEGTYRIGYWYWEFDEVPSSWDRAALDCDEIWTATRFIADGLRARYRQPVKVLLPGVELAPFEAHARSHFGLAENDFVFVFVFHMTSVMERKNPLGLISAFRQAFRREDRATLVIKTSFAAQQPEAFARLEAAAAAADVVLIDATFSRNETLSLIAAGDAYVSLHRCEGLGLSLAEAMLLGRPVVATRYSGNLEFMDEDNSLLVDCERVVLSRAEPPYLAGQHWAEPSVAHAAVQMRKLYDDPVLARRLGARGQADMERRLNFRTTGRAMADRLAEIAAMT